MKRVNLSKTVLATLLIGLTSCVPNNTIQSTEATIEKSGFSAPNKFETSVFFPDYMVENYKSRNMSTKGFSIKQMKQVDAVRIVIKAEDGSKQEKIVSPSSTQVTATFDNVPVGRVKVYAEAWGTGGYQPENAGNVITSGEAFVAVSENKLSEAFIALEIPKAKLDEIIEKKYGKGSVKAIVTLVEKADISINPIKIEPPIINQPLYNPQPIIKVPSQPVVTQPAYNPPPVTEVPSQPIVTQPVNNPNPVTQAPVQPVVTQPVNNPLPVAVSYKYDGNPQSTTNGGGTYGSILRMSFISNTFIVEKISGEFSKDSTVELKVGAYQDFGVTKSTATIKAGGFRKELSFDFNSITEKWDGGKDFFFVIKNAEGGSSWVGPIKISRNIVQ